MTEQAGVRGSFKQRKGFENRQAEVASIRQKFPNKVPVIVERYAKEKDLPVLDKTKFLVPEELSMGQFLTIIRNRMSLRNSQAFYLLVNGKNMSGLTNQIGQVYTTEKDPDGFLYMVYASQEFFG